MSGSMTFVPDTSGRAWLTVGLLLLLLAGCGPAEVVVKGDFPSPTMEKLPLTIGIWYEPAFANHEFFDEAKSKSDSSWLVKTGEAQASDPSNIAVHSSRVLLRNTSA